MVRDSNVPSVDLYPEVVVFVIFIIVYTFGSAISAGFAHLLFRLNGKQAVCELQSCYLTMTRCKFSLAYRLLDVSLMSLSIFVQNILTLVQETFSFASWPSLQVEKHEVYLKQWRNPDASIAYETSPNILIVVTFTMSVLPITEFYLRRYLLMMYILLGTYFFNVESLLFFFWSLMLFVSIWEIESLALKSEKFVTGTKWVAFILPAFQTILTNLPPIKDIPVLHLTIEIGISKVYPSVVGLYSMHFTNI